MEETKNIVIIGGRGRIGAALTRRYSSNPRYSVTSFGREELDLADRASIDSALLNLEFDLLINAAAMTNVDACEQHPEQASRANTTGPAHLAEICRDKGARMFHISTDYVYDGESPGLRHEGDATDPTGIYGQTKLAGENAVLETLGARGLVIRTSWVFGPDRPSFPDMILEWACERDVVEAIDDKWSCPCYSEDFANYLELLFANDDAYGVLHLCNSGSCSWFDYGQAVLSIAEAEGVVLKCSDLKPIELYQMNRFVASRPVHTAMATVKFAELTGVTPRGWQVALREYLRSELAKSREA